MIKTIDNACSITCSLFVSQYIALISMSALFLYTKIKKVNK